MAEERSKFFGFFRRWSSFHHCSIRRHDWYWVLTLIGYWSLWLAVLWCVTPCSLVAIYNFFLSSAVQITTMMIPETSVHFYETS